MSVAKGFSLQPIQWTGIAIVIGLVGLCAGRFSVNPGDLFSAIQKLPSVLSSLIMTGQVPDDLTQEERVILLIRLPRLLTALIVGAGLAVSGAVYQGVFRNPLVSPDILGVASGCMFGAAMGLIMPGSSWIMVQLLAFVCGLSAACAAMFMAKRFGSNSLLLMIMTGIIVGSIFGAALTMLKALADPYGELPAIVFWLMGSLSVSSWSTVAQLIIPVALGYGLIHTLRYRLNVLCLGDHQSRSLGVEPARLRLVLIVISSFIVASCVATVGSVAWIGLVVPHMVRTFTGANNMRLIPISTAVGAMFLLLADSVARASFSMEIPIGIVTSLVGAPLFAFLLFRFRQGGAY
ncbi:iron ABC transporter permease [Shewanella schlegeliana]|uniref:Iron ABC transporter permease n=1 Tax=Shewanella schlegeliana TaxID=190308 RepID=A0ABS1SZ13_9GAMM|nr:iron ABC transporter permease [Shewanella schlegeliana]MBL4912767.1 iron ABC transporter permease [Shewanella schlegeliana]MCL1111892.1 iron ABC transporter permease [Shewanella schlegeliana]GIU30579.1 iron ABC transporter permease [Shewanella schlegeliana]